MSRSERANSPSPLVIGLTGGIGSGKSTVAQLLAGHGALVIDVDALGRAVLEPEGDAYGGVVAHFGPSIVAGDGSIDRGELAAVVFGGDAAGEDRLGELEAISHPAINRCLATDIALAHREAIVVLDLAVLVESRLGQGPDGPWYHRVIVVETPLELRLERLSGRGMSREQAVDRIASQATDGERRRYADLVVVNDQDQRALATTVAGLWPTIEAWRTQPRRAHRGPNS